MTFSENKNWYSLKAAEVHYFFKHTLLLHWTLAIKNDLKTIAVNSLQVYLLVNKLDFKWDVIVEHTNTLKLEWVANILLATSLDLSSALLWTLVSKLYVETPKDYFQKTSAVSCFVATLMRN